MQRLMLVICALVCAGVGFACKKTTGPNSIDDVPVGETVQIADLSAPVDVVRDEWGRAHIYAENEVDMTIAAGYVQASDRFLQMDLMRRFAAGTTAELAGVAQPELVEDDYMIRVIGLRRAAQAIWDDMDQSGDTAQALTNFAKGVNAYVEGVHSGAISPPIEYSLIQYPVDQIPLWTEVDSLSVGRLLAFDQSFYGDFKSSVFDAIQTSIATFQGTPRESMHCDVVFRSQASVDGSVSNPDEPRSNFNSCLFNSVSMTAKVSPVQARAVQRVANRTLRHPLNPAWAEDAGSNNWIISGAHTKSGAPMLANDPHLPLTVPSIWYQVHMNTTRAGGNIDAQGAQLPGIPSLIAGHNGRVAWGVTNVIPDVTDNYVEQYSVGTGTNGVDQVLWDDDGAGPNPPAYVDLQPLDVTLETRTGLTSVDTEVRQVLLIPHRPGSAIIPDSYDPATQTALSWQWTGFQITPEADLFMELLRADNLDDVLAAREIGAGVPPVNMVFITGEGDIGWDTSALYPVRDDDDGDPYTDPVLAPLPGVGTHEWIGYLPHADQARVINPASGWVQTANQDVLGQTLDNDPLNDPVYISPVFAIGFRGSRIAELLDEGASHGGLTMQDVQAIQADVKSPLGTRMVPHILAAIEGDSSHQDAYDLLSGWAERGFVAAAGRAPAKESADASDDAAATALFNTWLSFFTDRVVGDELEAMGDISWPNSSAFIARGLLLILDRPEDSATYDGTDSILFDDMNTAGTTETREDAIIGALDDATAWLNTNAPSDWAWGELHKLTLNNLLGVDSYNVPTDAHPVYPGGFPRHGDNYTVDVANWGVRGSNYEYGSGSSFRMIVEGKAGDFRMWMAFPGGVSGDVSSELYDNQAETYMGNDTPEFWYKEKDVAKNGQTRTIFQP